MGTSRLKLTVISLRHDPDIGFDSSERVAFCDAYEVQAWTERFFVSGQLDGATGSPITHRGASLTRLRVPSSIF